MTFLIFIAITFLGYVFFSFFKTEFNSFWERLSLGFLLGIGLVTLEMFGLGILNIPLTIKNIMSPMAVLIIILLAILLFKKPQKITDFKTHLQAKRNLIEIILFLLISFLVGWSFLQTLTWPPVTWDALALYDYRAKIFADTHSLAQTILTREPELASYTYSYPFFTSLAHALVYIAGGDNPDFIYTLFYLSFLVCFYHALKRISSPTISLFFTAIIAASQSFLYHSTIAYTNLAHATYLILSTIFLWQYVKTNKVAFVVTSTFFLGLSTWVRSEEPFWILNLFFLVGFLLYQKRFLSVLFYSAIFFLIRQPWKLYYQFVLKDIKDPRLVTTRFFIDPTKFIPVTFFFFQNVIFFREWMFLLFVFFLTVFIGRHVLKKNWYILLFLFGYLAVLWGGIYYYSINYPFWERIAGSAQRISFFLVPLLIYGSAAIIFSMKDRSGGFKKIVKKSFNLPL